MARHTSREIRSRCAHHSRAPPATCAHRQLAGARNAPASNFLSPSCAGDQLISETLAGVGKPSRAYAQPCCLRIGAHTSSGQRQRRLNSALGLCRPRWGISARSRTSPVCPSLSRGHFACDEKPRRVVHAHVRPGVQPSPRPLQLPIEALSRPRVALRLSAALAFPDRGPSGLEITAKLHKERAQGDLLSVAFLKCTEGFIQAAQQRACHDFQPSWSIALRYQISICSPSLISYRLLSDSPSATFPRHWRPAHGTRLGQVDPPKGLHASHRDKTSQLRRRLLSAL